MSPARQWIGRLLRPAGAGAVLLAAGWLLRPLEAPAWEAVRAGQPELELQEVEGALGQGLVLGILGGFRSVVADLLWIRMHTFWEDKDRPRVETMAGLVTRIDPRPLFFWINAARIIAYDIPNWRIREEGGYDRVPQVRQAQIDHEQAERAFAVLRAAQEFHPRDPRILLEFAQIHLNRLKDPQHAAEWFGKAADLPGAPHYAARLHAELLRQTGRNREALQYLRELHPTLPPDDPFAQAGVVLERIRDLEAQLKVPPAERYRPEPPKGSEVENR
jgi:tetratricopeptide (TPR) repeat protein